MKKLLVFGIIAVLALSMSACGGTTTTKEKDVKFTVAYLPNESTEQNADARQGMSKDLSEVLGMEVVEFQASDYNAVVEGMRTGKIDLAYFGPLSFCLANERAGAEPIGMKAKNGDKANATYKAVLVVKADSSIQSIEDIKGKSIAFVDPNSTSGNLIPSAEIMNKFPNENLDMDSLHTNGKFFSAVSFSGQHQAGLQAVIKGDVDVVPISNAILASEIKAGNAKESDIRVIHSSEPIPSEPMAIRGDIPEEIKSKVKSFMLSYNNEEYFEKVIGDKTARFVDCSINDYKNIIELNKQLSK